MRGTILKRAKGSWTIIIDAGKHPDGRRKQQWITVKGSKRDAERRLAEILNKVNSGLYIRPSKDTLGSFLETWLRDHISTRVRATTLDGYRWRARSIIKALGHHRLCDLEPHTSRPITDQSWTKGYHQRPSSNTTTSYVPRWPLRSGGSSSNIT